MDDPLQLALVFSGGMIAGLLYFGGLVLTILAVRRIERHGLFLFLSFAVRAGLALALFAALSRGRWQGYAACMVGFLAARTLAVFLWGPRQGQGDEVKAWRS